MKHEYYDICIEDIEVDHNINNGDKMAKIKIDQSQDPDGPLEWLFLTKEDIGEIAEYLDLVVYKKEDAI
jgi:hypothetical protein